MAHQVSPDVFTAAGVVAAGAAGVAIALGWWPLAALFLALRLAGANLDGAVARARGVSRPWGFVVNEIGDRTSDLLTFAGLAVWAARRAGPGLHWLSWPVLQVLVAALAATLPTFASLAAAAAGATRRNGGPLGKTERCLFVLMATAFPVIMPVLLHAAGERFADHHRAAAAGRASRAGGAAEHATRSSSRRCRDGAVGGGAASTATRISSVLRHWLWRSVSAVSGGLTVTGQWRVSGGCVVVANHSSHADTAALLAALPPEAQPVFVAAADYWFDVPVRRFIASSLAGVLPVRRSGGGNYDALLAAARPALTAGRTVVIYPEGTRSTDGTIGEFRSGALRLARECGVPIVPVALTGTADVLPKGGSYSPAPMQVRIGEPVDPNTISASQLREQVVALRGVSPASASAPVRTGSVRSATTRRRRPRRARR